MTRQILKSTTAIAMCLTLAVPAPVLAQTATEQAGQAPNETALTDEELRCKMEAEQADPSVELTEGELATAITDCLAASETTAESDPATSDGTSETTEVTSGAEGGATEDPATDTVTATSEGPVTDPAGTENMESTAESGASAETTATAESGSADASTGTTTETETATSDSAADTANDTATTDTATSDTATSETATSDTTTTETATSDTATADAATDSGATAEPETMTSDSAADAEATATAEGSTETTTETTAEGTDTPAAASSATTTTAEGDAATTQEGEAAATAEAEAPMDLPEVDPQEQADRAQELNEGGQVAAAAAAEDGTTAEAEVTTETVTEETARSSDEEFSTDVSADASSDAGTDTSADAGAEATTDTASKDEGLSNFEKAAILGLGALAVGTILNNGDKVVSNTGDRVVVSSNGQLRVLKDDDILIRRPGSEVRTETFSDGSTRTTVTRDNGVKVVTIRSNDGVVLRRTRVLPDGDEVVLFDDTQQFERVVVSDLSPAQRGVVEYDTSATDEDLKRAFLATRGQEVDRKFSLTQVRNIDAVRHLMPEIEVNTINFETGSAVIRPNEAQELAALGRAIRSAIEENPGEVFLIEGHTDAVGRADYNLALSDRRAESLALALSEYFDVPPENLVVQGYGEADLKVETTGASRENRRAGVRRITPLLQ